MIEVDRLMIEEYGIQLLQMMENAGRHLAMLARSHFLDGNPTGKKVCILAGSGGKGGGALVCGRNLNNWGAVVSIYLTRDADDLDGAGAHQARILQVMGIDLQNTEDLPDDPSCDLIVDGVIGYSLMGAPKGNAASLISWTEFQEIPVFALDIPSGMDATSGELYQPHITAAATMTLALPKTGLRAAGNEVVGDLFLADIGVPPELYRAPSLDLEVGSIFHEGPIIQII
jgi:NAD(P)H-hydrate epimerase